MGISQMGVQAIWCNAWASQTLCENKKQCGDYALSCWGGVLWIWVSVLAPPLPFLPDSWPCYWIHTSGTFNSSSTMFSIWYRFPHSNEVGHGRTKNIRGGTCTICSFKVRWLGCRKSPVGGKLESWFHPLLLKFPNINIRLISKTYCHVQLTGEANWSFWIEIEVSVTH